MAVLEEFKCPCCGGAISFDSTLQKMKCPYCDTQFDMESLRGYAENIRGDGQDDISWQTGTGKGWQEGEQEGMRVYVCRSCGGAIVGDENTAATCCPYCGNPVVMTGQLSGALRPDWVIPFKLDKAAAKAAFWRHLSKKRLLPKAFKDEQQIDGIKGIYVPFWLFGADVQAALHFRATDTHMWSDDENDYTETSYYSVFRAGDIGFDRVPVDGSSKMPDDLMESLEPFDFSEAVDFQTAYLAGYFADKYDVTAENSIERANTRIRRSAERAFAQTVTGYDTVTPDGGSIRLHNGTTDYALYPVWLLTTSWRGKNYTFAMNGQTGKFVGDLPMDKAAFWKWFGGLFAAVTAGVLGLSYLLYLFL